MSAQCRHIVRPSVLLVLTFELKMARRLLRPGERLRSILAFLLVFVLELGGRTDGQTDGRARPNARNRAY